MKIKLSQVERFREAAKFLHQKQAEVVAKSDDHRFIRDHRNAVNAVYEMAQALGSAELSIRG
ncbi:MAG: hypothetical protein ACYS7Y_20140 [Planctomycetota bacterium]|jgi:hypothetical protein